jgi:hypothetical protein
MTTECCCHSGAFSDDPAAAAVTGNITFTKSDHDSPIQIVASLTHVAGAHSLAW